MDGHPVLVDWTSPFRIKGRWLFYEKLNVHIIRNYMDKKWATTRACSVACTILTVAHKGMNREKFANIYTLLIKFGKKNQNC